MKKLFLLFAAYNWEIVVSKVQCVVASCLFNDASFIIRQTIIKINEVYINNFCKLEISEEIIQRSENYGTDLGNVITSWAIARGFAAEENCNYTIPQVACLREPMFSKFSAN